MNLTRVVLAVIAGYALMAVSIIFVQETLFGGIGYHVSSVSELLLAGLMTILCAVAGGAVARAIAGQDGWFAAAGMSAVVVVETLVLLKTGKLGGPLWFDLFAAASLIVGIFIGSTLILKKTVRW